jgi:glycosyltransferase involved in cell wall biosynthesis
VRIALVSDAWRPQVNGVVRTLTALTGELIRAGHLVATITPDLFRTVPCPFYPEIRLAVGARKRMARRLDAFAPDAIHVLTEGPLGLAARVYCARRAMPFTTGYCTRFPEYIAVRFGFPAAWSYWLLRRFHGAASGVMVATESIRSELAARGFGKLRAWTRGVDTAHFHPAEKSYFQMPRPVFLTVGRVALEKNLVAFLDLDLPGSKIVVGDGPQLAALRQRYPTVHFAGFQNEAALVRYYAEADVFVFPSRTDTFGLVMLEALASGVPVAAFPVPGPLDVIGDSGVGCLDDDLTRAALCALDISPIACRNYALNFTWARCAELFVQNLCPIDRTAHRPARLPKYKTLL